MSERVTETVCQTTDFNEFLFLTSLYLKRKNLDNLSEGIDRRLRSLPAGDNSPEFCNLFEKFNHFYGLISGETLNRVIGEFKRHLATLANSSPHEHSFLDLILSSERRSGVSSVGFSLGVGNNLRFTHACPPNAPYVLHGYQDAAVRSAYARLKLQMHIFGHKASVFNLKYDRKLNFLFSSSSNGIIKIWSLHPLNFGSKYPIARYSLRGHTKPFIASNISIDNHLLASIDNSCGLVIWCLRTGQPVVSLQGNQESNGAPVGLALIPNLMNHNSQKKEGWIVITTEKKGLRFIFFEHKLNPNHHDLVNGCCDVDLLHTHVIHLTDQEDKDCKLLAFDICPGFRRIAVGCSDMTVRFFSVDDTRFPVTNGRLSTGESKPSILTFGNTGNYLAAASRPDGGCWIWELEGDLWRGGSLNFENRSGKRPTALAWSYDDANLIVGLSSGGTFVFTHNRRRLVGVRKHEGEVNCIAVSPCSAEIFATGGADGRFIVQRLFKRYSDWEVQVLMSYRMPPVQLASSFGISRLQEGDFVDVDDEEVVDGENMLRVPNRTPKPSQAITCCAALPMVYGIGFILSSAGGVISIFKPSETSVSENESLPIDEQFFHWELQRADVRDVNKSCARLNNFLNWDSVQNTVDFVRNNHSDIYILHPKNVVREVYHLLTNVPFSRLPPPYLVDANGRPHPENRQKLQVPGRQEDGKPTFVLGGDDIPAVIDDIQFATLSDSYLFTARYPAVTPPDQGKKYLLRCHWLTGAEKLIPPFTPDELLSQINRVKELRTSPSNSVPKVVIKELLAQANARPVKQVVAEVMAQWSDDSSDPNWSSEDDNSTSQRRRQRLRNGSPSLSEHSSSEDGSIAAVSTHLPQPARRSLRQLERRRQAEQQVATASQYPVISDPSPAPQRPLRFKRRLQLRRKPKDHSNYSTFERAQLCRGRTLPNKQEHCQSRLEDSLHDREDELRQRIIRSIDHAEMHRVYPVENPPIDGFLHQSVKNPRGPWKGPVVDWLSATKPSAAPYVPQLGDRVVYVMQGHQEYLDKAWWYGKVPDINPNPLSENNILEAKSLTLPWEETRDLPNYICCNVVDLTYHFMRISRSETQCHGKLRKAEPKIYHKYPQSCGTHRHQPEIEDRSQSIEPEDGFVRLVSLRLEPDSEQPYASIGATTQRSHSRIPNALYVRYHNFLGGLDFLILRNLFDESIRTSWSKGDVFIFPTDTACFRGRVYEDYGFDMDSESSTFSTLPFRPDPWLGVKVMYLEDFEIGHKEYDDEKTEEQERQEGKYVDRLSPWDMHPWDSRLPISDVPMSTITSSLRSEVKLGLDRLVKLYGSGQIVRPEIFPLPPETTFSCEVTFNQAIMNTVKIIDKMREFEAAKAFFTYVDLSLYPNYIKINPFMIDLQFIRDRLESGFYRQKAAIQFDLECIAKNAERYNVPDSLIVRQAKAVSSLAVKPLWDPSYTTEKLVADYTQLVARDPAINLPVTSELNVEVVPNSASVIIDNIVEMDQEEEVVEIVEPSAHPTAEQVLNAETETTPSAMAVVGVEYSFHEEGTPVNEPAFQSAINAELTVVTDVLAPAIEQRHPLRDLASPTNPEINNLEEANDNEDCEWRRKCRELLYKAFRHPQSVFFRSPVDVEEYATYRDIVEHPMDLSVIGRRLVRTQSRNIGLFYTSAQQFIDDLRLIVHNSRLFNRDPTMQVYVDTTWLERWINRVAVNSLSEYLEDGTHQVSANTPDENTPPRRNLRPRNRSRNRRSGRRGRPNATSRSRSTRRRRRDSEDDDFTNVVEPADVPSNPHQLRPRRSATLNSTYLEIDEGGV
nr:PH interacting protein [Hymenolepis microstoma]